MFSSATITRASVCVSLCRNGPSPPSFPPFTPLSPPSSPLPQIKILDPRLDIESFLSKAIEPPVSAAVRNAIALLQDVGALDPSQQLTPLGTHLGALPLHPVLAKMLLHALLLDCLGPALTVAAASAHRDPFVLPLTPGQRHAALAARQALASQWGGASDHLAVVAAFDGWAAAKRSGATAEKVYCARNFLSSGTLGMLAGMRKQLRDELRRKGFLPPLVNTRSHNQSHGRPLPYGYRQQGRWHADEAVTTAVTEEQIEAQCSANGRNQGVVRAVLAAGLYPMVASLLPKLPGGSSAAIVQTARGDKVRVHPHSINFRILHGGVGGMGGEMEGLLDSSPVNPWQWGDGAGRRPEASARPLLVYDEVTRGDSNLTIRLSTVVRPLALVLIASEMVVAPLRKGDVPPEEGGRGEGRRMGGLQEG